MSHCLVSLKNPTTKKKKQHKVAFTEYSSEPLSSFSCNYESVLPDEKCHSMNLSTVDVEKLYNGCLLDLVCSVCTLCLDEISQNNSLMHLNLLSRVVPHFTSMQLLRTLNKTGDHSSSSVSSDGDSYCNLSEQFLNLTLFSWIKLSHEQFLSSEKSEQDVSGVFTDSKSVDYIIAIFCGIIRILPVEKQEELVSKSLRVSIVFFHS